MEFPNHMTLRVMFLQLACCFVQCAYDELSQPKQITAQHKRYKQNKTTRGRAIALLGHRTCHRDEFVT